MTKKWTADFINNLNKVLDGAKDAVPEVKDVFSGIKDIYGCLKYQAEYQELASLYSKECTWTNLMKYSYLAKHISDGKKPLDKVIAELINVDNICVLESPSIEICNYYKEETQMYLTRAIEDCGVAKEDII